jgi:hypothetical protein
MGKRNRTLLLYTKVRQFLFTRHLLSLDQRPARIRGILQHRIVLDGLSELSSPRLEPFDQLDVLACSTELVRLAERLQLRPLEGVQGAGVAQDESRRVHLERAEEGGVG